MQGRASSDPRAEPAAKALFGGLIATPAPLRVTQTVTPQPRPGSPDVKSDRLDLPATQ